MVDLDPRMAITVAMRFAMLQIVYTGLSLVDPIGLAIGRALIPSMKIILINAESMREFAIRKR